MANRKQPKALLVSNQGSETQTRRYTLSDGVCYVPMRLLRLHGTLFEASEYWSHAVIGSTTYPIKGLRNEATNTFTH